jgi:hypothetical protein
MSFTPYEHILPHNSPVYVGKSTRRSNSEEALMRLTDEANKRVLGKRKISGPFVPPPPLKGFEHATSERTSPSGSLKHDAGLSTSTGLRCAIICDTTTKPKVVTRGPHDSTARRAATTDVKASERLQDPRRRRSHKKRASSLSVGQDSSPSAQETKPGPPTESLVEPSTHDRGDSKICEDYKELDKARTDDPAKTRSPTTAFSKSQYLTPSPKGNDEVSECVYYVWITPSLELSDIAILLSHHIVNIIVGADRRVYQVHRRLLCQHSKLLRLRFQDTKLSSATDEFVLPRTEEKAFDSVVNWLYRGCLRPGPVGINRLYLIYYLAEELGFSVLGNLIMDSIRERYRSNPSPGPSYPGIGRIQEVYRRTAVNSPLRRFVVQSACWSVKKDGSSVTYFIAGRKIVEEFVRDFMKARQEGVGNTADESDPRSCAPCTFHIHEDGSKCDTRTAAKT